MRHAEGNYDPIPRGIITLSSFNVKSSDLVNKYVRGTFQRDEFDENKPDHPIYDINQSIFYLY